MPQTIADQYGKKWGALGFANQAGVRELQRRPGDSPIETDQIIMERAITRVQHHATMERTGLSVLALKWFAIMSPFSESAWAN